MARRTAMVAAALALGGAARADDGPEVEPVAGAAETVGPISAATDREKACAGRSWLDGASLSLVSENDLFGGTDRNYTNGVQLSVVSGAECELFGTDLLARRLLPGRFRPEDRTWRAGFTLGQAMFTPEDISLEDPDPTDRPYAGWLYTSFVLISEIDGATRGGRRLHGFDTAKLDLGWVGDGSQGEWVQRHWHDWINAKEPRGWAHQIKDEPGINLTLESTRRVIAVGEGWLGADVDANAGVALGNVATYASVGGAARLGANLGDDYGPPRIRPSLGGAGFFEPQGDIGWYLFAGVEGRAVARDIFLDGNTFRDSRSVDKEPFVLDAQAGAALRFGPARLSFTYVHRTESFKGQDGADRFGAVTLSVRH